MNKKSEEEKRELKELLKNIDDEESPRRKRGKKKEKSKKYRYFFEILGYFITWYIVSNISTWNLAFITKNFENVIPLLKLSLGVNIISNLILLIIEGKKTKSLILSISDIFSIFVFYRIYVVYPFKFEYLTGGVFIDQAVRFSFLVATIGLGVALVLKALQLILED